MDEKTMSFLSEVKDRVRIVRNANQAVELLEAPRFSVFDYIDMDENKLSDIITDLLNPYGNHGQGYAFLQEFLQLTNLTNIDLHKCRSVKREISTRLISASQRRMDIVIDFTSHAIMIENKPWAADQEKQLSDYREHLHRDYTGNFTIIYLTSLNRNPSNESIAKELLDELTEKNQFIQLSFAKDLVVWVERCMERCNPQNVRHFLQDFKLYLQNNFNTIIG